MIQKYFEYKLSSESYNSYYYLVLEEDDRVFNSLLYSNLHGLQGIANHIKVIDIFLSYENDILLIMNKDEVNKINDIEKFKYYDVDYLVKDNLQKMKRVLNYTQSREASEVMNHIMTTSKLSMGKFKDNDRYNKLKKICSTESYEKLLKFLQDKIYFFLGGNRAYRDWGYDRDDEDIFKIKNFEHLVSTVKDAIDTMDFEEESNDIPNYNEKMIRNLLEYKIIGVSSYYADETEYIVNSSDFKIPEQSTLVIHNPTEKYVSRDKFEQLREKYKIKIIYNKAEVYPIIRHLNKIKTFDIYNV